MVKVARVERRVPPDTVVTDPSALRWGIVSTIKAPLSAIARFAAWHFDAGAAQITIYLDAPDAATAQFLRRHPALEVVECDPQYWSDKPEKARSTHQLRQAFNATRSYRKAADLNWLAHLDVDEFLLSGSPMATLLAASDPDCAFVRLSPVEQLQTSSGMPFLFKRAPKAAGQPDSVLNTLFPTFGPHLPHGFISYSGGKNIVRTGLGPLRLGLHGTKIDGARITNGAPIAAEIGHAHAPDFETFLTHLQFRLTKGSYRNLPNGNRSLNGILKILQSERGKDGLRQFYTEVATARPELCTALRELGMLVECDMDLDARVARHFGPLPPEART